MPFSRIWKIVTAAFILANISYAKPRPTGRWISPEYKWFFQYPLPIPTRKVSKLTYTNNYTNATIDYYEVEVKTLKKQIYPDLPATNMIGYDGLVPGPMFVMQKGRGT